MLFLPATAFFAWLLWQSVTSEQNRIIQDGENLVHHVSENVERDLGALAASTRLAAAAPRLTAGNIDINESKQSAATVARSMGVDIVVRDPSGQELIDTRLIFAETLPRRQFDTDLIAATRKQPVVSDLFHESTDQQPMVAMVAPVIRSGTNDVGYFIDFVIPAGRIRDKILEEPLPPNVIATVLDRKGQIIARSRSHEQFVGTRVTDFLQRAHEPNGRFEMTSLDGVPVLVQYSRVGGTDWVVAVGIERSALNAPLWRSALQLLALGFCLALLSVLLAYIFGKRISDSLRQLCISAMDLGRGEPVASIRTSIAEVNQVSRALVEAAHERKVAEEHQTLMVRELHHRVKNTLATVQAVVSSSARTAETISEFRQAVTDRIGSLARTHTLLVNNAWGGASLRDILWAELEPYADQHQRVELTGCDVHVPDDMALAFGMAVHELTTNAAKHGSLSVPQGRIHVSWNVGSDAGSRFIELLWAEVDGPSVGKPNRTGFGSMLLERVLTRQLQGQVRVDYAPSGLCVVIKAPLPDKPAHDLDS